MWPVSEQPWYFNWPTGIAIDNSSNVYVADTRNWRIQKFTSDGQFITKWGSLGSNAGEFRLPNGIAISSDGNVYVSDDGGNDRIQAFKQALSTALKPKAIIVAGSGPFKGNNLWDATQTNTNFAYRTLISRGYTNDTIYYLSADRNLDLNGDAIPDVDAGATNSDLQFAITQWANDAESLVVYLTGHGGDGTFRMSEEEVLKAEDLASWLNELQETIQGFVTVIYDAFHSGSFLSNLIPPPGKQRINITSTSPGETAYFLNNGTLSFSYLFWSQIFGGATIYDAYVVAKDGVGVVRGTEKDQNPQIDDNGNGIGNDNTDGDLARDKYIGNKMVTLPFSDGFESYSPNQAPPWPWLSQASLDGVVTNETFNSGLKSLKLSGGPFASQSAVVDLGTSYPNNLSYEGYIKLNTSGSGAFIGFLEQVGNQLPQFNCVYFNGSDGKVYFYSADQNYPVSVLLAQSFALGIWHKVHVDLNYQTLKGNVCLNDGLVGNSIPISPKSATWNFNNFMLSKIGAVHYTGSSIYFDDFQVAAFDQQQYILTVTKSGTGSGTVTSNPSGIDCGSDCSESYNQGTSVTLTATPTSGSSFAGWSGGGCSGTGTCVVVMNADIEVTATFSAKPPAISVSPSSLDFGSVTVGKKITKTLKIANNSSKNLIITISGLEGTDFSIQGNSSVTIKAKKSYSLKVLCKPTSGGIKTAILEIQSSDPDTPTLEISLKATLPATTPEISIAQTSIEFGSAKVGKKATKTLKITNNGTGDLMMTLSGLEGTDFGIQGNSSVTIKAKKSYSLKVLFTPKSAGLETATLEITSNDPDTPTIDVSLSGTGQ